MPLLKVNTLKRHLFSSDQPGPLTLALHGFLGTGQDFESVGARWGVPLLAPDLLGHGESPIPELPPEAGFAAQLDSLCALVDAQEGPLNLLGYSMGGRLALHLLRARPARFLRVALIGGSPGLSEEHARAQRRAADEALAQQALALGSARFAELWAQQPILQSQIRIPQPWRERMRARREGARVEGLAWSLRACGTGALPSLWEELPRMPGPALLLAGALDPKFVEVNREMQARWPLSQAAQVPEAGHCAHLEAPEACAAMLRAFLCGDQPL